MREIRFTLKTLTITIFIFTLAAAAQAQNRVFVSGLGSDANPCTRTSPCRNFQRGHDAVVTGGEVVALDSAGYGRVSINKSITITGEGVHAGIFTSAGNAVTVETNGITVNLRWLTIDGASGAAAGIVATEFAALHVENCVVSGLGTGLLVFPNVAGPRKVFIKDSIFRNNQNVGIQLTDGGTSALVTATIERTRAENNQSGIQVDGPGVTVTARYCSSSGSTFMGFSSSSGVLNIESSVASNNGSHGIASFGGTVRVSNSTVTNNTGFGFFHSAGSFESRGNNTVAGNNGGGAQTDGTITPLAGT